MTSLSVAVYKHTPVEGAQDVEQNWERLQKELALVSLKVRQPDNTTRAWMVSVMMVHG